MRTGHDSVMPWNRRATRERRKTMFSRVLGCVTLGALGGTVRVHAALRRLHRQFSGTVMATPTVRETTEGNDIAWDMVNNDLEIFATKNGHGVDLRSVIEVETLNYEQGEATPDRKVRPSGRKAAAPFKIMEQKVTANLEGMGAEAARAKQVKYIIKITFDARQISKTKAQTEVMLILIPEGREGELYCQSAMRIRTLVIYTGKDSKELLQSNLETMLHQMQEVRSNGLRYCAKEDTYLKQDPKAPLLPGDRNVEIEFVIPADMCALFGLHGHGGGRDPKQEFCTHCKCKMEHRHMPFQLIKVAEDTTVDDIAKKFSMPPELVWALNAGSDPTGMLTDAELTDASLHHKTQPLARVEPVASSVEATTAAAASRHKGSSAR